MDAANAEYEAMMLHSFSNACRVLKPGGQLTIVYAHKTTLGWATLVEALRTAGFMVTEAWPLNTERGVRLIAKAAAALASSIFLVGRKREGNPTGSYETDVQPQLEAIVRERVDTLWDMGVSGADLVIACVGAGLCAFTRFARVEYANGTHVELDGQHGMSSGSRALIEKKVEDNVVTPGEQADKKRGQKRIFE